MSKQLLTFSNGTNTIRIFGAKSFYDLISWLPGLPAMKDNGNWTGTMLADGKQLIAYTRNTITDTFEIAVRGKTHDELIANIRALIHICESGMRYWTDKPAKLSPAWIEVRGIHESLSKYAVILAYSFTTDYSGMELSTGRSAGDKFGATITLTVEHGIWQSTPPGELQPLPLYTSKCIPYPYVLYFNYSSPGMINYGSDSSIDNLADNAFTVEAWIKPVTNASATAGRIFDKANGSNVGWLLRYHSTYGLYGIVYCATTHAEVYPSAMPSGYMDAWHHVAMTWDDAADRKLVLFLDGVKIAIGNAGVGAIVSDAANNLTMGNTFAGGYPFHGYIGWARLSNDVIYTADNFTPPPRESLPNVLTSTLGLWIREGTGTTIDNLQGSSARDGTMSGATWYSNCEV